MRGEKLRIFIYYKSSYCLHNPNKKFKEGFDFIARVYILKWQVAWAVTNELHVNLRERTPPTGKYHRSPESKGLWTLHRMNFTPRVALLLQGSCVHIAWKLTLEKGKPLLTCFAFLSRVWIYTRAGAIFWDNCSIVLTLEAWAWICKWDMERAQRHLYTR